MHDQADFPTHDDISALARRIWEEEGQPDGKAEDHWRLAELQLRLLAEDSQQTQSQEAGIV